MKKENITENAKNKAENEKKREEGRIAKKLYRQNKRKVMEEEKINHQYIIVVKENEKWYKMFAKSALYFKHYVVPKIQEELDPNFKSPNLVDDTDYDAKDYNDAKGLSRVLNFNNIILPITKMEELGFEQIAKTNGDDILKFKMDRKFTDQDIEKMQKIEDDFWHEINKTIIPKESYPNLSMDMLDITRRTFHKVRKFHKDARDLVGRDIISMQEEMMEMLIMAERGRLPWDEFIEQALKLTTKIYAGLVIFSEVRLIDRDELLEMAKLLTSLEKSLEKVRKVHVKKVQ